MNTQTIKTYLVGGAVRDLLIGKHPKDFDIATSAEPARIRKLFKNSRIIGKRFRLVHVFYGPKIYEVSTFRSLEEGSVGNSFGTIDEDVRRRDFTLNALYYDPIKNIIVDYVGGVEDIRNKRLRPIIGLSHIFVEDPVRMLRAVKYSAMTGARMPFSLRYKIRKSANLLETVSASRLTEELLKIINSGRAYDIVREALETDLYMYLQPAATSLMYESKDFESSYMKHLQALDELSASDGDVRLGRKLVFIVQDFIETLTDWKKEVALRTPSGELYIRTWSECRKYVLPMNPQRTELEFAVRAVLQTLGVSVRSSKKRRKPIGHADDQ